MKAISTSGFPCLFVVRFAVFCHKVPGIRPVWLPAGRVSSPLVPHQLRCHIGTAGQADPGCFFLCQKGTRIALMHAIDNASRLLTNCKSTSYNGLSDSKIGFGVISVIWSFFKY